MKLGRFGPWLTTTVEHARGVLTDPERFDFVADVSRQPLRERRETATPQRSPHPITAPLSRDAVARGQRVFAEELERGLADPAGRVVDAMQALRQPVARSTTAAAMPGLSEAKRNEVGDLVLEWIDALAPIIASSSGSWRWSRIRRRERAVREHLDAVLAGLGHEDPNVLATLLAAGIQVPIAAGSWLLVELAENPDWVARVRDEPSVAPAAVWEVVRLCSPTWITVRRTLDAVHVGSTEVERDSLVMVSPLLLGRDESLVPGPRDGCAPLDHYSPGRWTDSGRRPGAWLPFGAGPHTCPGRNLGLAQLTHLAIWASRWDLALPERVRVDQSRGIFPSPARIQFRSW